MVEEKFIFQIDSPIVKRYFDSPNFIIDYASGSEVENDLCAIYFSSNEIYYPNTNSAFEYSIVRRNKFEWRYNKFPNARKHIFLRDLRKQWYIGGINSQLDDISKLEEFLKQETKGFRIYTIGSSAGGYASILLGSLLNAERVYAFNSQFNLFKIIEESCIMVNPILFDEKYNSIFNQYFDLSNFVKPNIDYFYFQSIFSNEDRRQFDCMSDIAKKNISLIRFKTSKHGFPVLKTNIPILLSYDKSQLDYLVNKIFHPIIFSIKLEGYLLTLKSILNALYNKVYKIYISYLHQGQLDYFIKFYKYFD